MAFANFHGKSILSAAGLLPRLDATAFQSLLRDEVIGVAFDGDAVTSDEARASLELLVNLLARLYPALALTPVATGGDVSGLIAPLADLARAINPAIDLHTSLAKATRIVVVGRTPLPVALRANTQESRADSQSRRSWKSGPDSVPHVYIGSSGWTVALSDLAPVGSGSTSLPFAAGAAACFAAAWVFRSIFAAFLPQAHPSAAHAVAPSDRELSTDDMASSQDERRAATSEAFRLSLRTLKVVRHARGLLDASHDAIEVSTEVADTDLEPWAGVDVGETFLVGVGAIGEAAVWALARTPLLRGTLHVIDGELLELSNLQRYVLAEQQLVGRRKVDLARAAFATAKSASHIAPFRGVPAATERLDTLQVEAHAMSWADYVGDRGDYAFERILLALDSAEDRIAAQASLPRWIANAWTQPENLGVSRHDFLGPRACVACLYLPHGARPNKDQVYADALRAQGPIELLEIRQLLHSGRPVGPAFLSRAAQRLGVPVEPLATFADQPLEAFYTQALCGGLVLNLGGQVGAERATEVPVAFQSALAGILLAAELVLDAAGLRSAQMPARTEIDMRRPLGTHLQVPAAKHPSGRCLCQDPVYMEAYRRKYLSASHDVGVSRAT